MMRYLCRPAGQHDGVNSELASRHREGQEVGASSSSALTATPDCSLSQHCRMEVAQRVREWVEVAAAT